MVADLRRWADSPDGYGELSGLLTGSELVALRARVERLLETPVMPHPAVDRHSIPWPPF
jgi:hypothetical protein